MQKEIEERMKFLGRGWIVYVGGGERQRKGGTLLLQIKHGKSVNN